MQHCPIVPIALLVNRLTHCPPMRAFYRNPFRLSRLFFSVRLLPVAADTALIRVAVPIARHEKRYTLGRRDCQAVFAFAFSLARFRFAFSASPADHEMRYTRISAERNTQFRNRPITFP